MPNFKKQGRGFKMKGFSPFHKTGPIKETTKAAIKDRVVEGAKNLAKRTVDPLGMADKMREYGSKAVNYISRMDDGDTAPKVDKKTVSKVPVEESNKKPIDKRPRGNRKAMGVKKAIARKESRPVDDPGPELKRTMKREMSSRAAGMGDLEKRIISSKAEPGRLKEREYSARLKDAPQPSPILKGPRSEGKRGKGTGYAN